MAAFSSSCIFFLPYNNQYCSDRARVESCPQTIVELDRLYHGSRPEAGPDPLDISLGQLTRAFAKRR